MGQQVGTVQAQSLQGSDRVPKLCQPRSPRRNVHLNATARCRGIDAGGYLPDKALHDPPLRIPEHGNRNCATLQILLRRHILIGRQE
jgi:hypothetical protein